MVSGSPFMFRQAHTATNSWERVNEGHDVVGCAFLRSLNNISSSQSGLDPESPKHLITLDTGPSISRGQACAGMMMLPVRQGLAKLLISIYYRVFSNDRLGEYSRKD